MSSKMVKIGLILTMNSKVNMENSPSGKIKKVINDDMLIKCRTKIKRTCY